MMDESSVTNSTSRGYSVNPGDIVERIKLYTEAYGFNAGRQVCDGTAVALGNQPWWDNEVYRPLMAYFKEERLREEREQHALEVEKARAQAVQPTFYVNQPAAQAAMSIPPGNPLEVKQMNIGESIQPNYFTSTSKT